MKKPDNIREFVWQIIDTDLSLKKDIARGIINVRSLANYILSRYKVNISIDSVISAIRRYNIKPEKEAADVYALLKKAKIRTITKMASLSLKKNEEVTSNLGRVLPEVNFEGGEVLRVIEGAKLFKIIIDEASYEKMQNRFGKRNILESKKGIGMNEITYPDILKETPGVFAAISTELGANDISIIDALIISNEHIIVLDEKDLLKGFEILYSLCN
ncbi:MAG: hypothetical protein KJ922_06305 [Nanoarchaeota archaeon]|nr:hypothetical protein [Nanoarchaeota archaeon]